MAVWLIALLVVIVVGALFLMVCVKASRNPRHLAVTTDQAQVLEYHNNRILELLKLFITTILAEAAGFGLLLTSKDARATLRHAEGLLPSAQAIVMLTGGFIVTMMVFHKYAKARVKAGQGDSTSQALWSSDLVMCLGATAITVVLALGMLPSLMGAAVKTAEEERAATIAERASASAPIQQAPPQERIPSTERDNTAGPNKEKAPTRR